MAFLGGRELLKLMMEKDPQEYFLARLKREVLIDSQVL